MHALVRAHAEVCADGPPFIQLEHVWDVVAACRYTLRNLVRRRRDVVLKEQRRRELPDAALQDLVVEDVEVYMKEHRRAFEKSHAQVCFMDADRKKGVRPHHVKRRLDSRFNTMLNQHYGGRRCVRAFIKDGKTFINFRVHLLKVAPTKKRGEEAAGAPGVITGAPVADLADARACRQVPSRAFEGRKLTAAQKQSKRLRYMTRLVADIDNPDSEQARARKTRLMAAANREDVRAMIVSKLERLKPRPELKLRSRTPDRPPPAGMSSGSRARAQSRPLWRRGN
ncbi:MAG: hypothetical protein GY772_13700 [bacterium]|nr:hypothetical protein [bacterium]